MGAKPKVMHGPSHLIVLGKIVGAFGVRGEVKLVSWTEPQLALFRYQPWLLRAADGRMRELSGAHGRESTKGVIARLPGVEDRTAAEELRGAVVHVLRSALPPALPGEYYWVDLEGLAVRTVDGVDLGTVSHLVPTGANDVMVVHGERERLLPFVQPDFVKSVDFDAGVILVDWDPAF